MEHTEETKSKLSAMRKGKNNPFYGHKHTEETRQKLAKILRVNRENRQYDISPVTINIPHSESLAYLSGIVDGEGTIGFRRKRPFVAIYNSSEKLMDWIVKNIGGSLNATDKRGRVTGFTWSVQSAKNVYVLCRALSPYLIIKLDKANEVIKHLEDKYGCKLEG